MKDTATARLRCSECGAQVVVADGFNAVNFSRVKLLQCAMKLNWQYVPVFKCADCRDDKKFVWFTCSKCGVSEAIYAQDRKSQFETLKAKGWQYGNTQKDTRCGRCTN